MTLPDFCNSPRGGIRNRFAPETKRVSWCTRLLKIFLTIVLLWIFSLSSSRVAASSGQPAQPGNFDGPAELPRRYLKSSLADTPAPGSVHLVKESDDLQRAINDAKCGDTLQLQAGANFRGLFRFPKKACDDAHWIVVRTSAPDADLPPEHTILTPCYAGVASLPGRPDFHCSSVKNVTAKLELDRKTEAGPILFEDGANHYRFIGLEITRGMPGMHMRNLVQPVLPETTADHLVFDRLWLHGEPQGETKGGIHVSGTTDVAVVDSFFTDFHCIALHGTCTDAQAINGGTGDHPGGPYKIVNNFLEASGECVMFGGGQGSTTPADIEIRHNHFFKPLQWRPGAPGFLGAADGSSFIVKNLLEFKNAQRVLVEGNILEGSWGGFTQMGFAFVITPANQGGNCPACRVTDITIRYNKISHCGGGFDIANVMGVAKVGATAGERYSIHDLVFDDIDNQTYKGLGSLALIISMSPVLSGVHFDHITAFPPRVLMTIHNESGPLKDFSITNNIFTVGDRGMFGTGGGTANCTFGTRTPSSVLERCFDGVVFRNNVIIGGLGGWPKGNLEVKNATAVGFRDFRDGKGGDYRLCGKADETHNCKSPSPAVGAAINGRDAGADFDAIERAIAGII